jgi:hypothetical protein
MNRFPLKEYVLPALGEFGKLIAIILYNILYVYIYKLTPTLQLKIELFI